MLSRRIDGMVSGSKKIRNHWSNLGGACSAQALVAVACNARDDEPDGAFVSALHLIIPCPAEPCDWGAVLWFCDLQLVPQGAATCLQNR